MRKRSVAPLLACLTLAVPASASAHAKTPTVALDYRLILDQQSRTLRGAHVAILDGDRSLRVDLDSATVVVLGDLNEPMLPITPAGAWANRSSPTAVAQRLAGNGRGWQRVGGSTFTWHDHRLAPPPYREDRVGAVAQFRVPIRIDGRRAAIAGSFVRYRRPSVWRWIAAALSSGSLPRVAVVRRWPHVRQRLTLALGCIAGLAAVGVTRVVRCG